MEFKEALEIAGQHYRGLDGTEVTRALDAQTHWIFFGGEKDRVLIGGSGIKIRKADGLAQDFILPNDENFELLDRSEPIDF